MQRELLSQEVRLTIEPTPVKLTFVLKYEVLHSVYSMDSLENEDYPQRLSCMDILCDHNNLCFLLVQKFSGFDDYVTEALNTLPLDR